MPPRSAWLLSLVLLSTATPLSAQSAAPSDPVPSQPARQIQWWEPVAVVGGVGGLMLLDGPVHRFTQDNRSATSDDVARVFRHMGQPEVFATVPLTMLAAGLATHHPGLARAGGRAAAAVLLAGGVTFGGKIVLGRDRPNVPGVKVTDFHPFGGGESMPSGHTTVAFALAGSLADDIHSPWATVGLYTAATGVAWSRLNDEKHWLSDVGAAAAIGIYSAKLVSGRWRIFHIRPPAILLGSRSAGIMWAGQF